MITIRCKLVAQENDFGGYISYVFRNLDSNVPFGHKYCLVVRCPNWQHRALELNEIGYLTYEEVYAGDNWYDPQTGEMVPYKYTNCYFLKFVKEDNSNKDIII